MSSSSVSGPGYIPPPTPLSPGAKLPGLDIPESVTKAMAPSYPLPSEDVLAQVKIVDTKGKSIQIDSFDSKEFRTQTYVKVEQLVYDKQFLTDAAEALDGKYEDLYQWLTDAKAGVIYVEVNANSVKYIRSGPNDCIEVSLTKIKDPKKQQEMGKRLQDTVAMVSSLYAKAVASPAAIEAREPGMTSDPGMHVLAEGDLASPLTRELGGFVHRSRELEEKWNAVIADPNSSIIEKVKRLLELAESVQTIEKDLNEFLKVKGIPTYNNPRLTPCLIALKNSGKRFLEHKDPAETPLLLNDFAFCADRFTQDCFLTETISYLFFATRDFSALRQGLAARIESSIDSLQGLQEQNPSEENRGVAFREVYLLGRLSQTLDLAVYLARDSGKPVADEDIAFLQESTNRICQQVSFSQKFARNLGFVGKERVAYVNQILKVTQVALVVSDRIQRGRIEAAFSSQDRTRAFMLIQENARSLSSEWNTKIITRSPELISTEDVERKSELLQSIQGYTLALSEMVVSSLSLENLLLAQLNLSDEQRPDRQRLKDLLIKLESCTANLVQKISQKKDFTEQVEELKEVSSYVNEGIQAISRDLTHLMEQSSLPSVQERFGELPALAEMQKEISWLEDLVEQESRETMSPKEVSLRLHTILFHTDRLLQLQTVLKAGMVLAKKEGTDTLQRYEIASALEDTINRIVKAIIPQGKSIYDCITENQLIGLKGEEDLLLLVTAFEQKMALLQENPSIVKQLKNSSLPEMMAMQLQREVGFQLAEKSQFLIQRSHEITPLITFLGEVEKKPFSEANREEVLSLGEQILTKAFDVGDNAYGKVLRECWKECSEVAESAYPLAVKTFAEQARLFQESIVRKARIAKEAQKPGSLQQVITKLEMDLNTLNQMQYFQPVFLAKRDLLTPRQQNEIAIIIRELFYGCELAKTQIEVFRERGQGSEEEWRHIGFLGHQLGEAGYRLSLMTNRIEQGSQSKYTAALQEIGSFVQGIKRDAEKAQYSYLLSKEARKQEVAKIAKDSASIAKNTEQVVLAALDTAPLRDSVRQDLIRSADEILQKAEQIESSWLEMQGLASPRRTEHMQQLQTAFVTLETVSLEDEQEYNQGMEKVQKAIKAVATDIDQLDTDIYALSFVCSDLNRVLHGYKIGNEESFGLVEDLKAFNKSLDKAEKEKSLTPKRILYFAQRLHRMTESVHSLIMNAPKQTPELIDLIRDLYVEFERIQTESKGSDIVKPYIDSIDSAIEKMVKRWPSLPVDSAGQGQTGVLSVVASLANGILRWLPGK